MERIRFDKASEQKTDASIVNTVKIMKIRLSFKQPARGLETTEIKIIYINEGLRIFWQLYYEEGFIRKNFV